LVGRVVVWVVVFVSNGEKWKPKSKQKRAGGLNAKGRSETA